MNPKEEALLQRLRVTFQSEAEEHLRIISDGLLEAGQEAGIERQAEIVEASFRSAHSLKGAARAISLPEIETLCHALESVWAAVKQGDLVLGKPLLDILHPAVGELSGLLANLYTVSSNADKARIAAIVRHLEQAATGRFSPAISSLPSKNAERAAAFSTAPVSPQPQILAKSSITPFQ